MTILTIGMLKRIIENVPNDFDVEYSDGEKESPISDKLEIDIGGKRLILK